MIYFRNIAILHASHESMTGSIDMAMEVTSNSYSPLFFTEAFFEHQKKKLKQLH
jgi:hypothetical protein